MAPWTFAAGAAVEAAALADALARHPPTWAFAAGGVAAGGEDCNPVAGGPVDWFVATRAVWLRRGNCGTAPTDAGCGCSGGGCCFGGFAGGSSAYTGLRAPLMITKAVGGSRRTEGAARAECRVFVERFSWGAGRSTEFRDIRDRVGEATAVAPRRIPSPLEGGLLTRHTSESTCVTRWRISATVGSALLERAVPLKEE